MALITSIQVVGDNENLRKCFQKETYDEDTGIRWNLQYHGRVENRDQCETSVEIHLIHVFAY